MCRLIFLNRGRTRWAGALVLFGLAGGVGGCGNIEPVAPADDLITDPAQAYTKLTLDHPAVVLSTVPGYQVLQLTATPRNALGDPMSGLPTPTYRSLDTSKVIVSATGLITAVAPTTETRVVAQLTSGLLTRADTAFVAVTNLASPPRAASLSINPEPPDSAVWPWQPIEASSIAIFLAPSDPQYSHRERNFGTVLMPHVVDTLGDPITGLPFEFQSLDPAMASLRPSSSGSGGRRTGAVDILRPGQVRFVARTTVYGVALADTVTFAVTPPFVGDIGLNLNAMGTPEFLRINNLFVGDFSSILQTRITPSGYVFWYNFLEGDSVDVIFDDPAQVARPVQNLCDIFGFYGLTAACGAGNVMLPPAEPGLYGPEAPIFTVRARQFPVPGVYPYHSTRLGISGEIVVSSGLED